MDQPDEQLLEKVQLLSDLELACLLCLVTEQHCIIECESSVLERLSEELKLIASNIFGLRWSSSGCSEETTVDNFGESLLVEDQPDSYFADRKDVNNHNVPSAFESGRLSGRQRRRGLSSPSSAGSGHIANVAIIKDLDKAHHQVQIQALELLRTTRIYSRTAVHVAPKPFLLIALLPVERKTKLEVHLNDHFFISHRHFADDELPNLQDDTNKTAWRISDASKSGDAAASWKSPRKSSILSKENIELLSKLQHSISMSTDIRAYLHDIVVFTRMHRAVSGGVSATATRHFNILARALAPLHGLTFITPSLVALAARKIYPHRLNLTAPENERSMQWGSSIECIRELLDGVTAQDVIEEVLQSVEAPL